VSGEAVPTEAHAVSSIVVYTHRRPEETKHAVQMLIEAAERAGVQLHFDADETAKHELDRVPGDNLRRNAEGRDKVDLCVVMGGDGTTLRSLRAFTGTDVPIFSVNCGRIGFLATVDRDQISDGLERALSGRFDVVRLPALLLGGGDDGRFALNEVSFQRGAHMNVAHLSYSLGGEEVARAQCDGLIAATPAGSTGYNLSAGGPILAWGVRGFVVSMIAPHALSARSLVAAPEDVLLVRNDGGEAVDVVIDGIRTAELSPGEQSEVRLGPEAVGLAQLPGMTFYSRFREKLRLLTA
jgi:NAD+ kinase